jgi:hypothetical protein
MSPRRFRVWLSLAAVLAGVAACEINPQPPLPLGGKGPETPSPGAGGTVMDGTTARAAQSRSAKAELASGRRGPRRRLAPGQSIFRVTAVPVARQVRAALVVTAAKTAVLAVKTTAPSRRSSGVPSAALSQPRGG